MIDVRVYAAPLPDGGTALVIPAAAARDLLPLGRLLAAHPDRVRVTVLVGEADAPVPADTAVALARRAACLATFVTAPASAAGRGSLPPLRGAWYVALVVWGWALLLAAGQSAATVLGGLWLAAGLPWTRSAARRRETISLAEPARWLAAAIDGAEVRTLPHAGLQALAQSLAAGDRDNDSGWLRRAAGACDRCGVPELAHAYAALAAGQQPIEPWAYLPPVATAPGAELPREQGAVAGTEPTPSPAVSPPVEVPARAPVSEPNGNASPAEEARHELL